MRLEILEADTETYLFLSGVAVARRLVLDDQVELLPATCSPDPDEIIAISRSETDIGVAAIFLRHVRSQLRISAPDAKELAVRAWNALWDAILLGAFCDCEVACNLQSDKLAQDFGSKSRLRVTNYHFRGFSVKPHMITDEEACWLEANIRIARKLLDDDRFQGAAHALASYRWHPHGRARLALLWAGIEGLFGIESEIVFRLSLYVARFLAPDDCVERVRLFAQTKKLYKLRSTAVHGGHVKGDSGVAVRSSVELLQKLLRRCVEVGGLPQVETLAP